MRINQRKPNPAELELKKDALVKAEACRAQLLVRQPFIGMLAMRMDIMIVVDSRLPTACTDGSALYFSAPYFMALDGEQRISLIAHEIWHCVFQHFKRRGNREHERFNYAADLEVDFMLMSQEFPDVDPLPHQEEWKGLSAESIYELLEENKKRPESADVHIYDDPSMLDDADAEEHGRGRTQPGQDEWIRDDDYQPMLLPRTDRKWRQWVVGAAQQIQRSQGSLPGYLEKVVKDLYRPRLNWKETLQQFVSYCFGGTRQWLPPSRRHAWQGLYLPSRKDEFLAVAIAIDTSGSTVNDLPGFLAELKGILSSFGRYEVTLMECDTAVKHVRRFSEWDPFEVEEFNFHGFGGTDFRPVFRYIDEHVLEPKLLVFMTDGYGQAPVNPPPYPVLWVLTSDGEPPADWGWIACLRDGFDSPE
jgi:predicted metal-dependent peptidase